MMDRQKVIDWLNDVIEGTTRPDDTEMARETLRLVVTPVQPDLTPYLAAAAIYVTATPNDGKVNVEAIIESARALRAAAMAEEK
jgi:hypothetical protein